jgi:hypothetical protein
MLIGSEDNVAAPPAVASVGSAPGHKFFPAKADTPAAAFSRLCKNLDAIDKHGANCHCLPALSSLALFLFFIRDEDKRQKGRKRVRDRM